MEPKSEWQTGYEFYLDRLAERRGSTDEELIALGQEGRDGYQDAIIDTFFDAIKKIVKTLPKREQWSFLESIKVLLTITSGK